MPETSNRRFAGVRVIGGRSALACALLLLATGDAPAAGGSGAMFAEAPLTFDQEPITPIPAPPPADPIKLALGQSLFEDTRLSHDGTRSCLSCHDTSTNGASARPHDDGLNGTDLPLNTNTVFNAALSFRFNWEGNYRTLEAQTEALMVNPQIFGVTIKEVVDRLSADPAIVRRFTEAYGHGPDRESLLDAIATYERSLVTPGSRFDYWLGGATTALTPEEQAGYQLFKSVGCVSCHQGVNIGGNLFERHGIFHPLASPEPEILRVPSLRNVATTAPYFHDGSAPTLAEAVREMGEAQLDRDLSEQQVDAIVAFLQTLTGSFHGNPVSAPPRPPS